MRKHPINDRRHPAWCDRQRCITSDAQVRHTSAATRLPTLEQVFELTLVQHNPGGTPELIVEVTDTELATPDGVHVLTLPEIKAFAETLLIEYLKAAQLTAAASKTRKASRDKATATVPATVSPVLTGSARWRPEV